MPHPYFSHPVTPRVIAHRGYVPAALAQRGIAENTHAAFSEARAAGAVYLESDCHLTQDGVVVLFHDDNLARVVGDPRRIGDVSHRELADIMRDRGGLVTLAEAFEAFPDQRFNIDVKAMEAADLAGRIAAPHGHRVLLTSFSDDVRLRALRAAEQLGHAGSAERAVRPATSAGRGVLLRLLLAVGMGAHARAARLLQTVDALQIPERQGPVPVFGRRLVDAAHAAGVEVHVWTVNDADVMRSLVARGADAIITDQTELALATLR